MDDMSPADADTAIRFSIFKSMRDRGAAERVAAAAMYALHPMDSDRPPSRKLERRLRRRSRQLATRLRSADIGSVQAECVDAMQDYVAFARGDGDVYYEDLFETMLDEYGT